MKTPLPNVEVCRETKGHDMLYTNYFVEDSTYTPKGFPPPI
jgi:hypothetical protein